MNPLAIAVALGARLDALDVKYAVGGSVASSMFGEPRSTLDIDIALRGSEEALRKLVDDVTSDFYVPTDSALLAIEARESFNLLHSETGLKIDLFVLGESLLDERQIQRRIRVVLPEGNLWVTSPEDVALRKLWWFDLTGQSSERQWRDVLALLGSMSLDLDDFQTTAEQIGLGELARQALAEAQPSSGSPSSGSNPF